MLFHNVSRAAAKSIKAGCVVAICKARQLLGPARALKPCGWQDAGSTRMALLCARRAKKARFPSFSHWLSATLATIHLLLPPLSLTNHGFVVALLPPLRAVLDEL